MDTTATAPAKKTLSYQGKETQLPTGWSTIQSTQMLTGNLLVHACCIYTVLWKSPRNGQRIRATENQSHILKAAARKATLISFSLKSQLFFFFSSPLVSAVKHITGLKKHLLMYLLNIPISAFQVKTFARWLNSDQQGNFPKSAEES